MTNPSNPDAMNSILRGRPAPAGQATPATPDDPIVQAKEIAAEVAGQIDTLRKLLAKASTPGSNPFAPKEG